MIKVIIFDIWDTLGKKTISNSRILKEHFGLSLENYVHHYEMAIQRQKWSSKQEMAQAFLSYFRLPLTTENIQFIADGIEKGWERAVLFPETRSVLELLKKNHTLVTLSNTNCFDSGVLNRWGINQFFDYSFWSWQIGAVKPDPVCFRFVCQGLGVSAVECLLVDDNQKNIEAARSLGLNAYQFTNGSEFWSFLEQEKMV